jgi:ribosomal protein S18 acetylase RimI-like enzyme
MKAKPSSQSFDLTEPTMSQSVCYTPRMSDSPERSADISFRPATIDDIPEILRQRRRMYEDMDYKDGEPLAAMVSVSTGYLRKTMADGTFRAWLAEDGDRIVAGGAVIISPWLAHPYDLECRRATILNVYTHPEYRRRGIGRRLMQTMIAWCRAEGFAGVTLHASKDGRHLYESLGFEITNEMRLKLR